MVRRATYLAALTILLWQSPGEAQCPSAGQPRPVSPSNAPAAAASAEFASNISSTPARAQFRNRRRSSASMQGLPQISNPYAAMSNPLAAFQAQQMMAQRITAESAVRNRRSPARRAQGGPIAQRHHLPPRFVGVFATPELFFRVGHLVRFRVGGAPVSVRFARSPESGDHVLSHRTRDRHPAQ